MAEAAGRIARDADGVPADVVSARNWRHARYALAATGWTLLGDGAPRNHLKIWNPSTSSSIIVLCNSDSSDTAVASNNPAHAGYGVEIPPGASETLQFTENVLFYARIKNGGAALTVTAAEGF